MKFTKIISKNPLEVLLAVVLIIFILSPIEPPMSIANMVDSTLGIILTSVLIVYLFVYSHTLLAILFVIAVFELVRRSSSRREMKPAVVTYTALQPTMGIQMAPQMATNPVRENTNRPDAVFQSNNMEQNVMETAMQGTGGTARPMGRKRPAEQPVEDQMIMNQALQPRQMIAPESVMSIPQFDGALPQYEKDTRMMSMNNSLMQISLEEEAVHAMPIPNIEQDYLDSSYKPVYDNIHQASSAF